MISDDLFKQIQTRYPERSVHIEVSEDGENGSITKYDYTKEQTPWQKGYGKMDKHIEEVFNQIDSYREFCVENGYSFNEADIGRKRTPWDHMQKNLAKKRRPYNQWIRDSKNKRK